MSDLKKYIAKLKKTDKNIAEGFEEGYGQFKTCNGYLSIKRQGISASTVIVP